MTVSCRTPCPDGTEELLGSELTAATAATPCKPDADDAKRATRDKRDCTCGLFRAAYVPKRVLGAEALSAHEDPTERRATTSAGGTGHQDHHSSNIPWPVKSVAAAFCLRAPAKVCVMQQQKFHLG